ncbi:dockerin type I repeat-containing protein [Ruminococcus difficilis]|uniref:Dockerin type I repeat-containing protein n=1 Tax=Ruminococcus difficilis TaxID=2763069 RepID=A0A935C310_9FIRM|nr:dockerin type I repeat-containing protein [Ruminococcus difficilis]MBK6089505.1 dockerin type I repeat-containing protein [Ruminococcus difficilis]
MKITHIICGLLAFVLPLGCAVSVSAATHIQHTDSSLIGDVDNNCYINISDATLLQKQLAEFDDLGLDIEDYRTIKALDVNNDNNITIYDVTTIQRYLAEIPTDLTGSPITKHNPITQVTKVETIVDAAYTFKAGGKWEQHAFCCCCHQDLTIMYRKYIEENPKGTSGYFGDLTSWAQTKHQHSEWMYSPVTGKLIKVLVTCDGTIWHKDFGRSTNSHEAKEKIGAKLEPVYIGGKEYTYPAIRKITYTETTDGVVTRQWAEQTAYPGLDEIINGTYTEQWVSVDP